MSLTSRNIISRGSVSYNDELPEAQSFLPNLPGFRSKRVQNPFRKSCCELFNGVGFINTSRDGAIPTFEESTMIGGSSILLNKSKSMENVGINLTFMGYFEEHPEHLKPGQRQIRKVKIFYYMEDDTIKITEKPQVNSGTVQGVIVRRSILFKEDGMPYTQFDLKIGSTINILSRQYTICDAEPATRMYMVNLGFEDTKANTYPEDSYQKYRLSLQKEKADVDSDWARFHSKKNDTKAYSDAKMGVLVDNSGREGFNKFGKTSLNFRCMWDNTLQLYGDNVELSLGYYLSDDTVQVMTVPEKFSMGVSKLMKRGKLPKDLNQAMLLGQRLKPNEYIRFSDLYIGMKLNVFGRVLELLDADSRTRDYYIKRGMPLGPPVQNEVPMIIAPVREIPPPTGFGSEEDSMRSVNGSIMPGPPPSKKLGENKVISFLASLTSGGVDDVQRKFVVTYYMQDCTLKITEPQVRNSGFSGGLFLSRREIKKADGKIMKFSDLYIGCNLRVLSHNFRLLDANASTLKWMEDQNVPRSSYYAVIDKIRPHVQEDAKNEVLHKAFENEETPEAPRQATLKTLRKVLSKYKGLMGDEDWDLSEHELRTILRGAGNARLTFNYRKLIEQLVEPTDEFK